MSQSVIIRQHTYIMCLVVILVVMIVCFPLPQKVPNMAESVVGMDGICTAIKVQKEKESHG